MNAITTQSHQDRLIALAGLLDSLEGRGLPEIRDWTSNVRDYQHDNVPTMSGSVGLVYQLSGARSSVAAWGQALGAPVTEKLVDSCLTVSTAVERDGLMVVVQARVYVTSKCPGCGGPAIGDDVLRHFTDTPCGAA